MKRFTLLLLTYLMLFPLSAFALEDLDELEARTSRKSVNTFYNGEGSAPTYYWQPQTMVYTDTSTGHEVMLWSQTANVNTYRTITEYGMQPWSADGKRIAFTQDISTAAYTRSNYPWYVARADGTYFRPVVDTAHRDDTRRPYYNWSPTLPDVSYTVGYNAQGVTGKDSNGIYREVATDSEETSTLIVDLIPADTTTLRHGGMKHPITGDGLYYAAASWAETEPFYIAQIEPSGSRALTLSYNQPTLDTYWTDTPGGQGHYHDECFTGNAAHGYWQYLLYTSGSWWRQRPWGSDSGTPDHVVDNASPYDWWDADTDAPGEMPIDANKEIQAINGKTGTAPDFAGHYWSHMVCDQWGTHVAYSDSNGSIAPGVWDVENSALTGLFTGGGGVQYSAWTGFTDFAASTCAAGATDICSVLYNSVTDGDHTVVSNLHSATVNEFTKPGQSPDGTKISSRSDWLNTGSGIADLFMSVAYYPYPPEVRTATASGGTVTVAVDWNTVGTTRGYATRGWPHQVDDDPPPPREIATFRLWRSPNGTDTWTAVDTTAYDIFDKYDFSDGTWDSGTESTNRWSMTNAVADGTYYYAVTSLEHSGLESHSLSNIFSITVSSGSGTGSEDTGYPASPGADSNFYTTASAGPSGVSYAHQQAPATAVGQYTIAWSEPGDTSLVRHYNIYAEDGSEPTVDQTNRIASIAKGHCAGGACSWVDWLGNTGGTTQYVVTSIDYFDNEGTVADAPTPSSIIFNPFKIFIGGS